MDRVADQVIHRPECDAYEALPDYAYGADWVDEAWRSVYRVQDRVKRSARRWIENVSKR